MQWQICIPKIPGFYFSSLRKLVRHTNSQIFISISNFSQHVFLILYSHIIDIKTRNLVKFAILITRLPLSKESSMETLMSLGLLSLFSTERHSCWATFTILCFPSSGDSTLTVGLHDTTVQHTPTQTEQNNCWLDHIPFCKTAKDWSYSQTPH